MKALPKNLVNDETYGGWVMSLLEILHWRELEGSACVREYITKNGWFLVLCEIVMTRTYISSIVGVPIAQRLSSLVWNFLLSSNKLVLYLFDDSIIVEWNLWWKFLVRVEKYPESTFYLVEAQCLSHEWNLVKI